MKALGISAAAAFLALVGVAASHAEPSPVRIERVSSTNLRSGEVFKISGQGFLPRELWYGGPPIVIDGVYATVVGWADDRIYAKVPPEIPAGKHKLWLRINGQAGEAIEITVSPAVDSVDVGDEARLVLTGGGYGTSGSVAVDGKPVEPFAWAATQITLSPDVLAVAGKHVFRVTVAGLSAEREVQLQPIVHRARLITGVKDTLLELEGRWFGNDKSAGELALNQARLSIATWAPGRIQAVVPPALVAGRYPLVVRIDEETLRPAWMTIVPVVRGMSYSDGRPGDDLELSGAHFPADPTEITVTIGTVRAKVLSAAGNLIKLRVPADAIQGDQLIRVSVASGQYVSPAVPFKVLPSQPGKVKFEEFGDAQKRSTEWEEFGR